MLRTSDYDYPLPERLIARHPPAERSGARMMVLHRAERRLEHRAFTDFPSYLRPGDLAVLNDARVIPARVFANDGALELLVTDQPEPTLWTCMVKPGRRARLGATVQVGEARGIVERVLENGGERVIRFDTPPDLERHGAIPLPPYMERDRRRRRRRALPDRVRPRARGGGGTHGRAAFHPGHPGKRAARVRDAARRRRHVQAGQGRGPGRTPHARRTLRDHAPAADAINARAGRLVAIGTTTVRVLEACARDAGGRVRPSAARRTSSSIRRRPSVAWTRC